MAAGSAAGTRGKCFLCLAAVLILLTFGSRPAAAEPATDAPAGRYPLVADRAVRNIIFLIGDGMGTAQIVAARIRAHGAGGWLAMDRMPVIGHVKTYSADQLVTDSAAAGTALAAAIKTDNMMVAMEPDGTPVRTIMEAAHRKGLATGLVVTATLTHATPAVFAAHLPNRYDEAAVAPQLLNAEVDVLLGGGRSYFLPDNRPGGLRKDGRDIITEAIQGGYRYVDTPQALKKVKSGKLLGLFADGALTTEPPEPSLADMTQRALALLSQNRHGFFVMIEGSQIDWGGHRNNPEQTVRQTLLFDAAVQVAVEFARRDDHTLVVVTADHETGGMAIVGGRLDGSEVEIAWTTHHHTGVDVPIFAFGPHAIDFTGTLDNTDIPQRMARRLGLSLLPGRPLQGKAAANVETVDN